MLRRLSLFILMFAVVSPSAFAHPGHGDGFAGFGAGFAHPLFGLDHLLAMIAVGLWAGLRGGRATWMAPSIFVACMVVGFALALAGMSVPAVEVGIAASVVILGILIAAARRVPLAASAGVVGLFAIFHGHAHGTELSGAAPTFALGLIAATLLLHGTGIVLSRLLVGQERIMLARRVGGAVAGIGLLLLGGWL